MSGGGPIRVLIADDHPVVREGLRALVARRADMEVVAETATGRETVDAFLHHRPDVALVDLRLPDMDAVAVLGAIRRQLSGARVIVLTSFSAGEDMYRALRAGAACYMKKDTPREELMACIRAVHEGKPCLPPEVGALLAARIGAPELTPREMDVLRLIAAGKGNKQISAALRVAEGTVKAHVNRIFLKLGVSTRAEAITVALRRGLVHLEPGL